MRAFLAAISADRISGGVIFMAGLLAGVLVFFVAIPIAMSSPYPAPKEHAWVIESASYRLASAGSAPAPAPIQKSSLRVASLAPVAVPALAPSVAQPLPA